MDLLFNVGNQDLVRKDANTVIADSKNYLRARFVFTTTDWENVTKTAVFQRDNKTYNVVLVGNECAVPHEVLTSGFFTVSVFGGNLITTGAVQVRVNPSGYALGGDSQTPTPDVYTQITSQLAALNTALTALTARVEALEQEDTTDED